MFWKLSDYDIEQVRTMFEKGIQDDRDCTLLGNSVYYYCCGKDAMPVIEFGGRCPLYVYADIVDYGMGCFEQEIQLLYYRLQKNGFDLKKKERLAIKRIRSSKNVELSMWQDNENGIFFICYIQGDAEDVFRGVYSSDNVNKCNYIQPKCICNYRDECLQTQRRDDNFLFGIQKRTEYVLGHVYSDKYTLIKECAYCGDYGSEEWVALYYRKYWYVF